MKRSTRRGKYVLDEVKQSDYCDVKKDEVIVKKKETRSGKAKDLSNIPLKISAEIKDPSVLTEKNDQNKFAALDTYSRRTTRSHKEINIPESNIILNSKKSTRNGKQNNKENITTLENEFSSENPPNNDTRRALRRNKNKYTLDSNGLSSSQDLPNDPGLEKMQEAGDDKPNKYKKRNLKQESLSENDEIVNLHIVPSKRGSTDGIMNISAKTTRTRRGKKSNQENLLIGQKINSHNTRNRKRSSNNAVHNHIENLKNDSVTNSGAIDLSNASNNTSYHSVKESPCFQSKEDLSFSSTKGFDTDKNFKEISIERDRKSNSSEKKSSIDKNFSFTTKKETTDILNDTYPILVDDSINSEVSLKLESTMRDSAKKFPQFMSRSKDNLRISGIEALPEITVPKKRNLKRERTFTKETTIDLDKTANKTVDNSHNQSKRRHVFSAASPCKLFLNQSSFTAGNNSSIHKPKSSPKTPMKTFCRAISVGSAGRTPMPPPDKSNENKSAPKSDSTPMKRHVLNVTHSVEKEASAPNLPEASESKIKTRVAFSSASKKITSIPTNINKIVKSNLKGSTKSFTMTNITSNVKRNTRKRSLTQTDTETRNGKMRKIATREAGGYQMNKAKTPLSAGKHLFNRSNVTICTTTPAKSTVKLPAPVSRSKMPDFASLHKKQFDQMESLVQNKARKEERAKQLLFSSILTNNTKSASKSTNKEDKIAVNGDTKSATEPIFTRFGFKINPSEPFKFGANITTKSSPLPSVKLRKMSEARQIIMKEEKMSVVEKKRLESRNYVKGVRTNRRFELQMKARNLN